MTVLIATISVQHRGQRGLARVRPRQPRAQLINFRTGALITGVVGVLIHAVEADRRPPSSTSSSGSAWYGGLLATVAGILIADYWLIAAPTSTWPTSTSPGGRYWYTAGWNWRAVVATLFGWLLAVGGAYSDPGEGPVPRGRPDPVPQAPRRLRLGGRPGRRSPHLPGSHRHVALTPIQRDPRRSHVLTSPVRRSTARRLGSRPGGWRAAISGVDPSSGGLPPGILRGQPTNSGVDPSDGCPKRRARGRGLGVSGCVADRSDAVQDIRLSGG